MPMAAQKLQWRVRVLLGWISWLDVYTQLVCVVTRQGSRNKHHIEPNIHENEGCPVLGVHKANYESKNEVKIIGGL